MARSFLLRSGLNRIGSQPSNEVYLEARGVSKLHALLEVGRGEPRIEDLASKNGTFVNDVRVESTRLEPGDRLHIGSVELRLFRTAVEDCELAIVADAASEPAELHETSRVAFRPADAAVDRWMAAVEEVAGRLSAASREGLRGRLGTALAPLAAHLGAAGVCVLEQAADRPPTVVGAYGEVDPTSIDALSRSSPPATPAEGFDVRSIPGDGERLDLTVASSRGRGNDSLVLVLAGGADHAVSFAPLLRCLLRLLRCFHDLAGVTDPALDPRPPAELSFPPGYLRCESPAMDRLYQQMRAVAGSSVPVLIQGETGVGKEGVARILHRSSERRRGPFVAINCAAIPTELLEAELFGIGAGVATGVAGRPGKFQLAAGGTLFLDEISEMPGALQAKLLRALQENEIQPVGGQPVVTDVRILAATNTRIEDRIEAGTFRSDLYYRLAGFEVRVPALREHRQDVPALVEHFLRLYSEEAGKPVAGLTLRALQRLVERPWPGNVRQLQNDVRRLVYLTPARQVVDSSVLSRLLGLDEGCGHGEWGTLLTTVGSLELAAAERRLVEEAMRRAGGNRADARRLLGLSREALRRRLIRHGLLGAS